MVVVSEQVKRVLAEFETNRISWSALSANPVSVMIRVLSAFVNWNTAAITLRRQFPRVPQNRLYDSHTSLFYEFPNCSFPLYSVACKYSARSVYDCPSPVSPSFGWQFQSMGGFSCLVNLVEESIWNLAGTGLLIAPLPFRRPIYFCRMKLAFSSSPWWIFFFSSLNLYLVPCDCLFFSVTTYNNLFLSLENQIIGDHYYLYNNLLSSWVWRLLTTIYLNYFVFRDSISRLTISGDLDVSDTYVPLFFCVTLSWWHRLWCHIE